MTEPAENKSIFVAFASRPKDLLNTVVDGVSAYRKYSGSYDILPWTDMDIGGQLIWKEIFSEIDRHSIFIADVSVLNENVIFEIGYAVGRERALRLFYNSALAPNDDRNRLGLFDVLGYQDYDSAEDFASKVFGSANSAKPLYVDQEIDKSAPIFLLDAYEKSDLINHIKTAVKKRLVRFRSHDPQEQARLPVHDAIREVASSEGVVATLVPNNYPDARIHNLRAAFVAGLGIGMDRLVTIIKLGDSPTPMDYRELTDECFSKEQIDFAIDKFSLEVTPRIQGRVYGQRSREQTLLEAVNLGGSVAENEIQTIDQYYLDTDAFNRTLRGEVRLITGRKGSGKSALFLRVRNLKRRSRKNLVIDLKPEGYKLLKFKEQIEGMMSAGSLNHVITALWEYVILLEIAYKIIEQDAQRYTRDAALTGKYEALREEYEANEATTSGDFSERLALLLEEIKDSILQECHVEENAILSEGKVSELVYRHPINKLRAAVLDYLKEKSETWVLVDNLDKGWPSAGVSSNDVLLINCLLESLAKIERGFRQKGYQEFFSTVFLRSDVYDNLVEQASDRGKVIPVAVDWTDAEALKEMLRRRFIFSGFGDHLSINDIWASIAEGSVGTLPSLDFVIQQSLFRPRSVVDFLYQCKSTAVNRRHQRIMEADFLEASRAFSVLMIENISLEMRDINPDYEGLLYEFVGREPSLNRSKFNQVVRGFLGRDANADTVDEVFRLLLWFGFIGIRAANDEPKYIFDTSHNMKMLEALTKRSARTGQLVIHPAFRPGLAIGEPDVGPRIRLLI